MYENRLRKVCKYQFTLEQNCDFFLESSLVNEQTNVKLKRGNKKSNVIREKKNVYKIVIWQEIANFN